MFKSLILTPVLLDFLKHEGFTHLLKTGANEEAQEFYLEAIKKTSRYFADPAKKILIEDINEDEFTEMAHGGIPLIEFFVTIPLDTYEKFIK